MYGGSVSMLAAALGCRGRATQVASARSTAGGAAIVQTTEALDGLLELPLGFSACVIQRAGDMMSDGHAVPEQPDGMACHEVDGAWVLLRNHELGRAPGERRPWPDDPRVYDPDRRGGVTRVVLDPSSLRRALAGAVDAAPVVRSNLVLAGTDLNCAGGPARVDDADGWITCEESDADDHGFAFWTRADDDTLTDAHARRLTSLGRFKREGVALDPATGVLFMTEDHADGLIYRHVPDDAARPLGAGRLEALRIPSVPYTDPRAGGPHGPGAPLTVGVRFAVEWVRIDDPLATDERCRVQGATAGASRFNRCEGIARDPSDGSIFFVAALAGPAGAGQVYRLDPGRDVLELVAQVVDRAVLSMPDNLVVSPWGELVICEDNYDRRDGATHQHVRVLGADGEVRTLVRNLRVTPSDDDEDAPGAELAGACFSPDGQVLFVNLQRPENVTVAITGDWTSWRTRS